MLGGSLHGRLRIRHLNWTFPSHCPGGAPHRCRISTGLRAPFRACARLRVPEPAHLADCVRSLDREGEEDAICRCMDEKRKDADMVGCLARPEEWVHVARRVSGLDVAMLLMQA